MAERRREAHLLFTGEALGVLVSDAVAQLETSRLTAVHAPRGGGTVWLLRVLPAGGWLGRHPAAASFLVVQCGRGFGGPNDLIVPRSYSF
jgi:hypothetical protein